MMKKLLLILTLLVCLSSVTAISNLGNFAENSDVQLLQLCDSCTFVNLDSINFPDGTIQHLNVSMTKNFQTYNFSFSNTSQLGLYTYTVCGDKNSGFMCERIIFEVTPKGFSQRLNSTALVLAFLIIIAFFSSMAFFGSTKTVFDEKSGKSKTVERLGIKMFGYGIAVSQLVLLVFLLYMRELGLSTHKMLNLNFTIILILAFGIAMGALIMFIMRLINPEDNLDRFEEKPKW